MSDEKRKTYTDEEVAASIEAARRSGQDFVTRSYKEYNATFAECVYCGWIDYLPMDWREDPEACARLLVHIATQHRNPDGSRMQQGEGDHSGLDQ